MVPYSLNDCTFWMRKLGRSFSFWMLSGGHTHYPNVALSFKLFCLEYSSWRIDGNPMESLLMHLHTILVRFIFPIESSENVKCIVPVKKLSHLCICTDPIKYIGKQGHHADVHVCACFIGLTNMPHMNSTASERESSQGF